MGDAGIEAWEMTRERVGDVVEQHFDVDDNAHLDSLITAAIRTLTSDVQDDVELVSFPCADGGDENDQIDAVLCAIEHELFKSGFLTRKKHKPKFECPDCAGKGDED